MKTRNLLAAGFAASVLALAAVPAHASVYQIQLLGLNLKFNQATGSVCDGGGCGNPTDPLDGAGYSINSLLQGFDLQLSQSMNVEMFIAPGSNINSGMTGLSHVLLAPVSGFFNLQFGSLPGLFTTITSGQITFSSGGVNMGGSGFSTVMGSQSLPFGFVGSNPINWSFSSGLGTCTGAPGSQSCNFSGTGELSWEVPEPGSLALLGLGLAGLAVATRRKQKQA